MTNEVQGRGKVVMAKWISFGPLFHSALRVVAASMFILAGTRILFAFPQGMPPDGGTAKFMTEIWIGGVLEVFGGAFILIGLCTRPIAFILAGEMAVAYFQYHATQGPWPTINGGVSAVLYCFVWLYLSAVGSGPWSVDAFRSK